MTLPTDSTPIPTPGAPRWSPWRRGALVLGLVAGGFVLGAGTLASASGGMPGFGGHWHGGPGARIGMIQHFVHGALENVGASTAQEDKIHDIIAATYTDLDKGKSEHDALRKQVLDLMRAPTIDRAAVEKLRAEKVADFDAKSKTIVNAVLDAAGQLTPDQRVKLADRAQERMDHPGWGGWHHDGGPMGGRGGPDGDDHHAPGDHGDHG